MSFFSVIIPLYNKENFIENTLKSVFNQSFTDFEVLIVNDGSIDTSEEKVLQFNDVRIRYFYKENGGVSSARNFGIEQATSNYITFLDADDYWYPNFLQEMFSNTQNHNDVKVFSAAIEVETSKKTFAALYSIEKKADCQIVNYFEASHKETAICTSCAVFHKSVFEKTGNFDMSLKSGEDTDMWIRIGLHYPVLFSWKILARYVYDKESLSKKYQTTIDSLYVSKYSSLEKTNLQLKIFLDLNRFSLAIKSKIEGDTTIFFEMYDGIDFKKLSLKKKIILQLPVFLLKFLIDFKTILTNLGLGNAVFK
jgi:glycosyltransferase involved in cell wall biosynthesis